MAKAVVMLFVTAALTGMFVMAPLSQAYTQLTSVAANSDNATLSEPQADAAEKYRGMISSLLQGAGDNIQNSDIAGFYHKLLSGYELDRKYSEVAQTEPNDPNRILPDIDKIYRVALTLPLEEAGKNIKDKEIAEFYYKFLRDAGWTIKPGK